MTRLLRFTILFFLLDSVFPLQAQGRGDMVPDSLSTITLRQALNRFEKKFGIYFAFSEDVVEQKRVTNPDFSVDPRNILRLWTKETGLDFHFADEKYVYIVPQKKVMLNDIVVFEYITRGVYKHKDGSFDIRTRDGSVLPGTTENDLLESLQFLPGVTGMEGKAGQFSVHGGNADENAILWDGIRIFHQGHLLGTISPFNPYAARKAKFVYKGSDVEYDDYLSGILSINTSRNIADRFHLQGGLNGLHADMEMQIPLIPGKWSVELAGRRSYENLYETVTFKKYEQLAYQHTSPPGEIFAYTDYNVKMNVKPSGSHLLSLSLIHIDNDLQYADENGEGDKYDAENDGLSVAWKYSRNNSHWLMRTSYSGYFLSDDFIRINNSGDPMHFIQENAIDNGDFLSLFAVKKNHSVWKTGISAGFKSVSYRIKERNGLDLTLNEGNNRLNDYGIFASYHGRLSPHLDLYAGLRWNYFVQLKTSRPEPRLRLAYIPASRWRLQVTAEAKHQTIFRIRKTVLSDLTGQKIWRLADKKHLMLTGYQITGGAMYRTNHWLFDVDMFYKYTDGLHSYSLGLLNFTDPSLHPGKQRAYGIDFFLRKKIDKWIFRAGYTLMSAERRFQGINRNRWFVSDNLIKHNVSVLLSYRNKNWYLGLVGKWQSGLPYTPLEINDYEEADDSPYGFYEFEDINSEVLSPFYHIDFTAQYTFYYSKKYGIKGKSGLAVKNITNNRAVLGLQYSGNNTVSDPVRIKTFRSVGIIPNFYIRFAL